MDFEPTTLEPLLRFFAWIHLSEYLQTTSKFYEEFAIMIVETIERSVERNVALRKLLESKDAAVRASLPPEG